MNTQWENRVAELERLLAEANETIVELNRRLEGLKLRLDVPADEKTQAEACGHSKKQKGASRG